MATRRTRSASRVLFPRLAPKRRDRNYPRLAALYQSRNGVLPNAAGKNNNRDVWLCGGAVPRDKRGGRLDRVARPPSRRSADRRTEIMAGEIEPEMEDRSRRGTRIADSSRSDDLRFRAAGRP